MKRLLLVLSLLIGALSLATAAFADDDDRRHGKGKRYCHDWHYGDYHWERKRWKRHSDWYYSRHGHRYYPKPWRYRDKHWRHHHRHGYYRDRGYYRDHRCWPYKCRKVHRHWRHRD